MSIVRKCLFLALLFLLPVDSAGVLRFSVGAFSVTILDLLILAGAYLALIDIMVGSFRLGGFTIKICVLLCVTAVFSAISFAYISMVNISYDLKITINILEIAALVFFARSAIGDRDFLKTGLRTFCFGVVLISILTVLKSMGVDVPGDIRMTAQDVTERMTIGVTGLVEVGLGHSTLIICVLPLVVSRVLFRRIAIRIPMTLCILMAGVIGYSRNLWIAMAVELLVLMLFLEMAKTHPLRKFLMALVFATGVGLLGYWAQDIYQSLVDLRPETIEERFVAFFEGFDRATDSLTVFLFGAGKGDFINSTQSVPHNVFLDLLVSKGLITLAAFLLLIGMILKHLVVILKRCRLRGDVDGASLATLQLVCFAGMFSLGVFAPIINAVVFWTLIAVATAFISQEYDEELKAPLPAAG